jgi:hypothetical protein
LWSPAVLPPDAKPPQRLPLPAKGYPRSRAVRQTASAADSARETNAATAANEIDLLSALLLLSA